MGQKMTTQLQTLHDYLTSIDDDIAFIGTHVDQLNTLLGDVIDVLGKPKELSDDLKEIGEVLSQIQSIASDATWIPEVGEAAAALSKALIPIVKEPPPAGGIGEVRTSLNEIDVVLTPLKNHLKEVQDPVKKVHDAIHTVELDVRRLVNGTEALIKRYGEQPPENVEKCARGLNDGISSITTHLQEAKDRMVEDLTSLLTPLGKIESAFHVVDGYLKSIQTVFNELDNYSAALREITNAVDMATSYGKKKIEYLFTWIGRKTCPDLYRKVKSVFDKANKFVNQLLGKIAHFVIDPINREVNRFETEIKRQVQSIPEVQALEQGMERAKELLDDLENEITEALAGQCAKVLEID